MQNVIRAHSVPAHSITRSSAAELVAAVRAAAENTGFAAAVAVTDAGGHLKAFERADDAPFLAAEVAVDKAWTAASYRSATHVWNSSLAAPEVAPLAHHPRLMGVGGGYPVIELGEVIGALGVSGGSAEQDQQAAEAALRALRFEIPA
ncbi:heme-binding protein [Streptomyces botrytidirepellens]|uniref:Heme-binding protein n=2 Tax=Streptomyces botrytidirepellens TaxID=2486417 RepID=A0A3M8TAV4_9ACTN|nr:heme-binding protein [Streptomyces botrytidirepellens]